MFREGRRFSPSTREWWRCQWFWHWGGGHWSGEQVCQNFRNCWRKPVFVCGCVGAFEKQILFYVFREENLAKIARRVKEYKVEELNPPREGKRLLVLDVDYTLFGELISLCVSLIRCFARNKRGGFAVTVCLSAACFTMDTHTIILCVFRSQVMCRNRSGADETLPSRVPDISLWGLRYCNLVYVSVRLFPLSVAVVHCFCVRVWGFRISMSV